MRVHLEFLTKTPPSFNQSTSFWMWKIQGLDLTNSFWKQCTWKSKAGRIKPVMLSSHFLSRWKCCEDAVTGILCCCSVAKLCPTLCNPMDCSTPGFLSFTTSWSLLKLMFIELVMPSNCLILCHPLLLPSVFPSIRVFSNESALCIRWPAYWSFSFSVRPCKSWWRVMLLVG